MKVTYNWLKDYVDFDWSPQALGDALTMVGLEVEGIEERGADIASIVVGEVKECGPHPNADKLSVCEVFDGEETFHVVCGAPNVRKGLKIAFARVGTVLPGGMKLKKAKIRGEVSQGMICSERELELSDEHEGILELDPDAPVGHSLVDHLGIRDFVLEIGLTPNRGDCLGVIGVAREVAALTGTELKLPDVGFETSSDQAADLCRVRIEDFAGCPRYIARVIQGVTIGKSPSWLANRLEAVGVRSISNIVDITNFVMMELGQPLHAFDITFVTDAQIVVRRATNGEAITTLDEVERKLVPEDLVIADAQRPVALAGVMGGMGSGVTEATSTILLESAYFEPGTIRRTSKRHALSSDSSYRFERGVDPGGTDFASRRAAQLMAELGGGIVAAGSVDVHEKLAEKRKITVDMGRVTSLLGTPVDAEMAKDLLEPLGIEGAAENGTLHVTVPTWRSDITRPVDIAEEVARRVGYEAVPEVIPSRPLAVETHNVVEARIEELKDTMCMLGFREVVHMSFTPGVMRTRLSLTDADPASKPIVIKNPLSDEEGELRTLLLPALLDNYARNLARGRGQDIRIFELRRVFHDVGQELPREPTHLAGILSGYRKQRQWDGEPPWVDFFDAKGAVEALLDEAGHGATRWAAGEVPPYVIRGAGAGVYTEAGCIGWVGQIDPEVLLAFELDVESVFGFELQVDSVLSPPKTPQFQEIPRVPAVTRDLALVVDESVEAGALVAKLTEIQRKLLEKVDIFDVYRGPQIGEGKKSIALSLTFRDPRKTLTDKDVDKAMKRVLGALEREFDATLRA